MFKKLIFFILILILSITLAGSSFAGISSGKINVQDISNLSKLFKNIENGDIFGSLSVGSSILGTESNSGKTIVSTINLYWPAMSVKNQFDVGLDLDNATYFYINLLRMKDAVNSYYNK